jgi:hypothetical protein
VKDRAQIRVRDATTDAKFVWTGFDGDDCFTDFHIDVTTHFGSQQFTFGPCAVFGLRQLSRFFRSGSQSSVSLKFQHPDIRSCDVLRTDGGYRVSMRFEIDGLCREFDVRDGAVQLEDEFLTEY